MTDPSTLRAQISLAKSPHLKRILTRKLQIVNLKASIESCRACSLGYQRIQSVPLDGPTHGRADLILVGEAPGFTEDKHGRPFIGRSGMLLSDVLEKAGTSRDRCVVLNTLCCRPPKNADPTPEQLAACRPNFERQLSMTGLWIGVALGGYALASVMGVGRNTIRISDYLDTPIWKDGRVWWGTYHPAYALRDPLTKRDIVLSIRAAMAVRLGEAVVPSFSSASTKPERQKETVDKLTELQILGKTREEIATHLHKRGWAYGYSEGLGTRIVITGNENVGMKAQIPEALKLLPRYSLDELLRIGEAGAGRGGWTRESLRRLHLVRDEFKGEIIA